MVDDLFYPYERKKLWTKEMILLSLGNFLLYTSLYMYLPVLPLWIAGNFNCSYIESALIVSSFALAMFLPGPFNNYLIDAFKRKYIAFWACIILGIVTLFYNQVTELWMVLAIRVIQGILFSIITTTISSTLVIDVTPPKKRTDANISFSRLGKIGIIAGIVSGIYLYNYYSLSVILYLCLGISFLAAFLILFIRVPFRAPLKPSFCSLDRFLLPRALPAALNMLPIPIIIGMNISSIGNEIFYLSIIIGAFIAFILLKHMLRSVSSKAEVEFSTAILISGLILLIFSVNNISLAISAVLIGIGVSISSSRFYIIMISLPFHCERGSANNTYYLMWELGIFIGYITGYLFYNGDLVILYSMAVGIIILYILVYELFTHKWYYKQMEKKQL